MRALVQNRVVKVGKQFEKAVHAADQAVQVCGHLSSLALCTSNHLNRRKSDTGSSFDTRSRPRPESLPAPPLPVGERQLLQEGWRWEGEDLLQPEV